MPLYHVILITYISLGEMIVMYGLKWKKYLKSILKSIKTFTNSTKFQIYSKFKYIWSNYKLYILKFQYINIL